MQARLLLRFVTLALLSAAVVTPALAQVEVPGIPVSFGVPTRTDVQEREMPPIDIAALLVQDSVEELEGRPFRFGYGFDVDYSLDNSGTWETLPDGSKLWRLRINCPGAYSINLVYRDFWLPPGARLFIYSEDASMVIGAFTEKNNKEHRQFATRPVKGDATILEYHEPVNVGQSGTIGISRIVHGYKDIFDWATIDDVMRGYDDADWCEINVNCPMGNPWYDEKRSVALILTAAGSRICTGALVNNVEEDQRQYFLTAWHCGGSEATWVFMFNYESPFCPNEDGPTNMTVQGSVHRATSAYSDFLLVEISEAIPAAYKVYYSGWDARDQTDPWAMCIHHPRGDIKKITRYPNGTTGAPWPLGGGIGDGTTDSHWEVELVNVANNGAVEHGSSGAPLYDPNHRIIGQLSGGDPSGGYCDNGAERYYGAFFQDMDHGSAAADRLRDWLDPNNTGTDVLDGLDSYSVDAAVVLIDATGSMLENIDGGPETRFTRAQELAKADVSDLFDHYPGVEVAVVSFYADLGGPSHITLELGYSNVENDVRDAIDDIGTPLPEYFTPLAEAMVFGADLLAPVSSPFNRSLYVYTDGGENESQHNDLSPVAGHCSAHLGGDPVSDHWNLDCDPYDNDPVCDPYQTCLADAFVANGIVNVRYFGQRITKQSILADSDLKSPGMLAASPTDERTAGRQLAEYPLLQYIAESSGGFFSFDADDNQPPVASCEDITIYADENCLAIGSINDGSYDPDGDPISVSEDPPGPYALGATAVTLIVTDDGGLADTCYGTVTVADSTAPRVTCPADISVGNDVDQCSAVVDFAYSATDNCPGVSVVADPPSGSTFPVGTTPVQVVATDAAGNIDVCIFSVVVQDTQNPVITCPETIEVEFTSPHQAVATFEATATDNCDASPTIVCAPSSGSTFPIGENSVTCTAEDDYGNMDTCSFTFHLAYFDIKPTSCPNPLNVKPYNREKGGGGVALGEPVDVSESPDVDRGQPQGVLPVAVLGTGDFDVRTIKLESILLNGVAPLRWNFEDVAAPPEDSEYCACTRAGADGFLDLTLKFSRAEIVATLGDVVDGEVVPLLMTGLLSDNTPLFGGDCVIIRAHREMIDSTRYQDGSSPISSTNNYPNPFNPVTEISFALPVSTHITLDIYNVLGQRVTTLHDGFLESGEYLIQWDATDQAGARVSSGVYFYRLTAGDAMVTRKMLLLK